VVKEGGIDDKCAESDWKVFYLVSLKGEKKEKTLHGKEGFHTALLGKYKVV